ncbi:MAG: SOS response-associated peptidase family protein [Pseudomonadota bacterium]
MCGKFTAMFSYAEVHAFESFFIKSQEQRDAENDQETTFRVMSTIPVHIWDREKQERRVVPMRWGFPHRSDWRRPDVIHARSETIEEKKTFRDAFIGGQRGIVLVKTFNEAPDIPGPTIQHTITPNTGMSGIAMVWRNFDVGAAVPLLACVMVTVPANKRIAALPTDRMPAILDPADWKKWTGEEPASMDELKAMLKTVEGIRWRMQKEEKDAKPRRAPTVSDPGGLF